MSDSVSTVLGGVLLFGTVGLLSLRWVWPRRAALDGQGLGLVLLLIVTLVGGSLGAVFWWTDQRSSFSWDLPPLASRMLAAAGWSFAVPALAALERLTRRRVQLALVLLLTYCLPLVGAIVLFHLDRFDFGKLISAAFFGVVGALTLASVWYLLRLPGTIPAEDDAAPPPAVTRVWLGLVSVVSGLWGLALFVTDDGPSALIWVWPDDLLTSRLIAVMLLTLAAGAGWALRWAETARIMLVMTAVYGWGVALASYWNLFNDRPVKEAYVVAFGLLCAGSVALLLLERLGQARVSVAGASR